MQYYFTLTLKIPLIAIYIHMHGDISDYRCVYVRHHVAHGASLAGQTVANTGQTGT